MTQFRHDQTSKVHSDHDKRAPIQGSRTVAVQNQAFSPFWVIMIGLAFIAGVIAIAMISS